ncbi:MAG: type 1 glutamine amidotransferase [Planctomycetota bacterium]
MAQILVVQHGVVGPVRLGACLRDHGFKLDIRKVAKPDQPDALPPNLDDHQAVISLGGPQSAAAFPADTPAWMDDEIEILKEAYERDLPIVGICLGHQLIARALGGTVERGENPEWGFGKVSLGVPGQTEAILGGMPWDTMQFQSHRDFVAENPPATAVLGGSASTKNQIMKVGHRTLGFQFHLEADLEAINLFADSEADVMADAGIDRAALDAQIEAHYSRFAQVADRLCINMATYLFPFHALSSA